MRAHTTHPMSTVLLVFACACGTDNEPIDGAITPQLIPPGFDFPANRAQLQTDVDADDTLAMRTHAWNVWAGLTTNSTSSFRAATLPIWETWLVTAQVFTDPPTEEPAENTTPGRQFESPSQFAHVELPVAVEESLLVGFNKYDPTMVAYALEGHPAPAAPTRSFYYTSKSSLDSLNATWGNTPLVDRKVADAPPTAIELKPVMLWVDSSQPTALPLWQGPAGSNAANCENFDPQSPGPTACHPTPKTWTSCVIVDPASETQELTPATQQQFAATDRGQTPACTDAANAQYGGLNMLYHFEMNAAEANDFNQLQGGSARAGDFAVLVAMHVNTKEIIEWTWQTFWWQGGQNPPGRFPGSLDDITDTVEGPWRNYAMCTAYSQTTAVGNRGDMRRCFNPFLETSLGIPDGIRSNCVTCHGTARYPSTPKNLFYPPDYNGPVSFGDSTYFNDNTKTDFSWAIATNAR